MRKRSVPLVAAFLLAACSSGDGGNGGPPTGQTGSIAITISPTTASVTAGANVTVTVTLTRSGGFAGAVNLAVSGLPANVTVGAATIAAGATSATLNIAAAAAAAAGNATITVRASGTGVTDATATFTLTVTAAPTGSFTLTANPTSLTVQQGGSQQTTITITRTAPFTGAVALTASGLPTGVTASFNPASATGGTSTLTLSAASNAATGNATITVRGTGTGVAERTVTVALTVNQTSTGGNINWPICPGDAVPLWFAYQDGTGPWTRVTPANNAFSFSINSNRGGIAFVTQATSGARSLTILYFSSAEFSPQQVARCAEFGTRTVNGTVAGITGGTQSAQISVGGQAATVLGGGSPNWTVNNVRDGLVDVLASRVTTTFNGTTVTQTVDKLIFRRSQNPANNSTLPVLDFGAAEAFDPVMRNVTVNNLMGDSYLAGTWYNTSNGFVNAYFGGGIPGASTTQMYPGIPSARQQAGDLHALQVTAAPFTQTVDRGRSLLLYFFEATDRTLTLGPLLNTPTMTTVATAPYVRFRAQLTVQPEYNRAWGVSWSQGGTGSEIRSVAITATSGYLNAPATVDIAIPDFTAVAGWDNGYGPRAGAQATWTITANGWTAPGGVITGPVTDGGMIFGGFRIGTITP